MNESAPVTHSGESSAAARPVRGYALKHGDLEAGDTFIWCGHLLRVEPGGIALGMPVRELTLRVSEVVSHCPCRCHERDPEGHSCTECFHTHAIQGGARNG